MVNAAVEVTLVRTKRDGVISRPAGALSSALARRRRVKVWRSTRRRSARARRARSSSRRPPTSRRGSRTRARTAIFGCTTTSASSEMSDNKLCHANLLGRRCERVAPVLAPVDGVSASSRANAKAFSGQSRPRHRHRPLDDSLQACASCRTRAAPRSATSAPQRGGSADEALFHEQPRDARGVVGPARHPRRSESEHPDDRSCVAFSSDKKSGTG